MAKKLSKKRKNQGGRPKRDTLAKRTERIGLTVFADERNHLDGLAADSGYTLVDFIRSELGLQTEGHKARGLEAAEYR